MITTEKQDWFSSSSEFVSDEVWLSHQHHFLQCRNDSGERLQVQLFFREAYKHESRGLRQVLNKTYFLLTQAAPCGVLYHPGRFFLCFWPDRMSSIEHKLTYCLVIGNTGQKGTVRMELHRMGEQNECRVNAGLLYKGSNSLDHRW